MSKLMYIYGCPGTPLLEEGDTHSKLTDFLMLPSVGGSHLRCSCTRCSAGHISTVPPRKTSDLFELPPYQQSLPAWRYATGR